MSENTDHNPILQALSRLLDDTTPKVREAVLAQLQRLGADGLGLLRQLREERSERGLAAAQLLEQIGAQDPRDAFVHFIRSFQYELESGSLMLARVIEPELDTTEAYLLLDEIAGRCRQLILNPCTAWQKCRTINRVLFHEYGFSGAGKDFYNPANSLLPEVLRRRRGIPISLAIVYLLVAARCDLELEPIGLPGRFMVGCFLDTEPFYVDVFEGGVFLSIEDVEVLLERNHIEPLASHFAPSPVGEVLQRCCRNLSAQYGRAGDSARSALFANFVHEFDHAYERHA